MKPSVKSVFVMFAAAIVITTVLGSITPVLAQTTPATNNLVKRDYSYSDDQHLTARFGNSKVCGDHLCAAGEWSKLQENLNKAQITHYATNSSTTVSMPTDVKMTTPANSTSTTPIPPVSPTPTPVPTPPSTPSSVCTEVRTALGNSTVPSVTVTKVMSDLGCMG